MSELVTAGGMETDNQLAEGDYVVQQGRGVGRKAKSDEPYNNTYCCVYKLAEASWSKSQSTATTELVTRAFGK